MRAYLAFLLCVSALVAGAAQEKQTTGNSRVLWIGLANGTGAEATTAAELRALLRQYNVEPWILTRRVLIDENQIAHSDPILTVNTGYQGKDLALLSTFLHEQLHWLEETFPEFRAAMKDYEAVYPVVPSHSEGGARDRESTYRHLLVCDLEYQAMTAVVGERKARETLAATNHYQWIYDKVLNDPKVRKVAVRHGFDVSHGAPRLK